MNVVQMDKLAQSARGESQCEFCGRPWFGLVAYCPYCGRKPSFTTINQEPDDRPQSDEASAVDQNLRMPAGELHRQEAKPPRKEPRGTPLQGAPISATIAGSNATEPTPSQSNKSLDTSIQDRRSRRRRVACSSGWWSSFSRPRQTRERHLSCRYPPQVSCPQARARRRAPQQVAVNATAHRHRGPAPIKQVAVLRGERDGRVVQIAGMSF